MCTERNVGSMFLWPMEQSQHIGFKLFNYLYGIYSTVKQMISVYFSVINGVGNSISEENVDSTGTIHISMECLLLITLIFSY